MCVGRLIECLRIRRKCVKHCMLRINVQTMIEEPGVRTKIKPFCACARQGSAMRQYKQCSSTFLSSSHLAQSYKEAYSADAMSCSSDVGGMLSNRSREKPGFHDGCISSLGSIMRHGNVCVPSRNLLV